jgi:hypothetical protein
LCRKQFQGKARLLPETFAARFRLSGAVPYDENYFCRSGNIREPEQRAQKNQFGKLR